MVVSKDYNLYHGASVEVLESAKENLIVTNEFINEELQELTRRKEELENNKQKNDRKIVGMEKAIEILTHAEGKGE